MLFAAGGAVTGGASLALADDPGKLDPAAAQTLNVLAHRLGAVSGGTWQWTSHNGARTAAAAGGLLFLAPLVMILFRQKYPR